MVTELFDTKEILGIFETERNLSLYGAGNICRKLLSYFEYLNLQEYINCIYVTEKRENPESISGIPVKQYRFSKDTEIILIAAMGLGRDEVLKTIDPRNEVYWLADGFEERLDAEIGNVRFQKAIGQIEQVAYKNKSCEDIRFFSPPYWDVYSPFSAVPCLVSKLKSNGYRVGQVDLGILFIHELIRRRWKEAAERVLSEESYRCFVECFKGNTYNGYEDYLEDMWFLQGEKYDVDAVKRSYAVMNPVQKRVVDRFYNELYCLDESLFDFDKCRDLYAEVKLYQRGSFLDYITSYDIVSCFTDLPDIVGISMTSAAQFLPGCLLAKLLKIINPNIRIIAGGSCADLFAQWGYKNKKDIRMFFDYLIIGEGETAIKELMDYLTGKRASDEKIPNVAYYDDKGELYVCDQIIEDVNELPCPDYDGLDLTLYLSPETILPYQTSRGCHYGQCAFCNHDAKYRHNYRSKDMKKVVDELLDLSQKYNIHKFQFVDEAIRFDCFEKMVDEMEKRKEFCEIDWFYYSRVDRRYTRDILEKAKNNGCQMVMFGVETLNQRLLQVIKKGIHMDTSRYCLKLFHEIGIKTFAWMMCNLPSETIIDAKKDLEDIKELEQYVDAISVGPFFLSRNTDMYANPEMYHITRIDENDGCRFDSEYMGEIIDKDLMMKFFYEDYLVYSRELFGGGNRYTLFLE